MSATSTDEFRRGHVAGEINARLAGHDAHFLKINGSIDASKAALDGLAMQVQRLADQAIARDATVLTTATALEKADTARRAKSEQSWSPVAKILALFGPMLTALGLYIAWSLRVIPGQP